jgi:hypothetical protein
MEGSVRRRDDAGYPGLACIVTLALGLLGVLTGGPGSCLALAAASALMLWIVFDGDAADRADAHDARGESSPGRSSTEPVSAAS